MRMMRRFGKGLFPASVILVGVSLAATQTLAKVCDHGLGVDGTDLAFFDLTASAEPDTLPPLPDFSAPVADLQSSTSQTTSTTAPGTTHGASQAQRSSQDQNDHMSVNPLTGLVTTTPAGYQPLTGDERWKLYWKMNYLSVGAYFGPFFDALLLDQATGSPAQWGGGFAGYGRRVASRTANAILQGTFQAPVAALLHEDVRYISSNQRSVKHRVLHAVVYSFMTYNDQGRPVLNIANLSAYYASTAVSTLWLPGHNHIWGYALGNSGEQIVLTVPVNILQEFWPEVHRFVLHRQ